MKSYFGIKQKMREWRLEYLQQMILGRTGLGEKNIAIASQTCNFGLIEHRWIPVPSYRQTIAANVSRQAILS
jgi:hypothetical protein